MKSIEKLTFCNSLLRLFPPNASEKWSGQFQHFSQFQTKQCSAVFSQWVWIWQTFGLLTDASQWPHKCARSWRKYIDVTKVSFLMTMELVGSKHLVQDLLLSFTLYIEQKLIYSHNQLMSDNNILNPRYDHCSTKLDVGLTLQLLRQRSPDKDLHLLLLLFNRINFFFRWKDEKD